MSDLKTMFQLSGRVHAPAHLSNATLIIIDAQKEYLRGPLALTGVREAMANIGRLVEKARAVKCPIVHIRHLGTVGGPFDPHG
ncbi:isochorismatase hydrolase, partial [Pseudomonas syringae pv. pisi str. 1704B]